MIGKTWIGGWARYRIEGISRSLTTSDSFTKIKSFEDLSEMLSTKTPDKVIESQTHKNIFSDLSKYTLQDLTSLLNLYQSQSFQNHTIFNYQIQKQIIENVVSRFNIENRSDICIFLNNYIHNNKYGLYCPDELEKIVLSSIESCEINYNPQSFVDENYSLLNFAFKCNFLKPSSTLIFSKSLQRYLYSMSPEKFLKFGRIFSHFPNIDSRFWISFSIRLNKIERLKDNGFMHDLVLLCHHLKVNEPRRQTNIFKQLSNDTQEEILFYKPAIAEGSFVDSNNVDVQVLVECLNDRKYFYEINHNDGFNLHVAVPFKRIAFDFTSPDYFIYPSGIYSCDIKVKHDYITKRKWKLKTIQSQILDKTAKKIEFKHILSELGL